MLTLDTPEVKAFLDAGDWPVLLDWLEDRDATLADVLRLFAGTPPHFLDGLPAEALTDWLERRGDRRWRDVTTVDLNVYERTADHVLAARDPRLRMPSRSDAAGQVRRIVERDAADLYPHVRAAYNRARRDLKRAVLALFPEVAMGRREHHVSMMDLQSRVGPSWAVDAWLAEHLMALGFRRDLPFHAAEKARERRVLYWQTVYASDLIPADPSSAAGSPRRAAGDSPR